MSKRNNIIMTIMILSIISVSYIVYADLTANMIPQVNLLYPPKFLALATNITYAKAVYYLSNITVSDSYCDDSLCTFTVHRNGEQIGMANIKYVNATQFIKDRNIRTRMIIREYVKEKEREKEATVILPKIVNIGGNGSVIIK